MRLIVCGLCETEEPFLCPVRFRRTYMQLHLQKSHGFDVKQLRIVRREKRQKNLVAEWSAELNGDQATVLSEVEVSLEAASDRLAWSAAAMQSVYREREGVGAQI